MKRTCKTCKYKKQTFCVHRNNPDEKRWNALVTFKYECEGLWWSPNKKARKKIAIAANKKAYQLAQIKDEQAHPLYSLFTIAKEWAREREFPDYAGEAHKAVVRQETAEIEYPYYAAGS
jgi:hypothetical protein